MKLLFLKLLRDIRNSLGQFLSILAVLAVGCYFFAGMLESNKLRTELCRCDCHLPVRQ